MQTNVLECRNTSFLQTQNTPTGRNVEMSVAKGKPVGRRYSVRGCRSDGDVKSPS